MVEVDQTWEKIVLEHRNEMQPKPEKEQDLRLM